MATQHERDVLARYSTPSLRRNSMSRYSKDAHLRSLGVRQDEADKIMADLYPPEPEPAVCQ